ncbi:unnamed protein product [Plutella xylostella]|uniref:(diamondback moth) hypothetical protein n=1 Tax=Plutella xylostella TaxID=51655 RepID=A0A8S4GC91_PLUXY|nr:unnamed protein product [Plutella xylostella]
MPQRRSESIVASYSWSLRDAQCVLGKLNFASFVVHRGRLHCRPLQMACVHLPKNKPFTKHSFDQTVLVELEWWIQALSANRSTQIHPLPCTHFLTTDASATGWGAVLDDIRLSGIWDQNQISWHSNVKEMWAIIQAIQELKHLLFNSTVLIQYDNKSVVSYIRNQGGLRSRALFQITNMLFHVMDEHNIEMIPQYIPGQLNTEAGPIVQTENSDRMVPDRRSVSRNLRSLRDAGDRFVRIKNRAHSYQVRIARLQRLERRISQRIQQKMAVSASMGFPTSTSCASSSGASQQCGRDVHIDSAPVAQGVLETRCQEARRACTVYNNESPPPATGHEDMSAAASSGSNMSRGLACQGWSQQLAGWSEAEKSLLNSSWRPSTRKVYECIWSKWAKWCMDNSVNHVDR